MYGELPHTGIGSMIATTVAIAVACIAVGIRLLRRTAGR